MLLQRFVDLLPERYGTYYEPFLGGASLYFLLQPREAVLSDACDELIATYKAVRDNPDAVLRFVRPLHPDKGLFYSIRSQRATGRYKRAAEFIYLNKTCWNGLYRVNGDGLFNVPYGAPKTATIVDAANLRSCAATLRAPHIRLLTADFAHTVADAVAGDLVFLDPPYVTRHNNNGFIDYNERLFCWDDQLRVADIALQLAERGVHVFVTNACHSDVLALYKGFQIRSLARTSTIASSAAKRGAVTEALLWHLAR